MTGDNAGGVLEQPGSLDPPDLDLEIRPRDEPDPHDPDDGGPDRPGGGGAPIVDLVDRVHLAGCSSPGDGFDDLVDERRAA